jgi:hypothetical protein
MDQASRDLGTRLDWVAVDHWNTEHPHIHILVRGRADDGSDLVISRDYIGSGLRARAGDLVTRELGPRSELEVRRGLEAEVKAERWTRLDRSLAREAGRGEAIALAKPARRSFSRSQYSADADGPARVSSAGDREPRFGPRALQRVGRGTWPNLSSSESPMTAPTPKFKELAISNGAVDPGAADAKARQLFQEFLKWKQTTGHDH